MLPERSVTTVRFELTWAGATLPPHSGSTLLARCGHFGYVVRWDERNRTSDTRIRSPVLYPLSYAPRTPRKEAFYVTSQDS